MYRYNKANLWLRTICVTVVLLGMLFFTQSQFSVAAPSAISVKITTDNALGTVNVGDTVKVEANFTLATGDMLDSGANTVAVNLKVGTKDVAVALTAGTATAPAYYYSADVTVAAADHGDGALTFVSLAIDTTGSDGSATDATAYTTTGTPNVTVTFAPTAITFDTTNNIADPDAVAVGITAADSEAGVGDDILFTANITNATKGKALAAKINYKIGDKAGSQDLANQDGTVWNATLTVDENTTAGNLTFDSIEIVLFDTAASTNDTRTYDATHGVTTDALIKIDNTVANETTSAASASSSSGSETTSDSPLSIVALFVLLTSVSVAIGVYTLKRKR